MRIHAKRAYGFKNGDTGETYRVHPGFSNPPDWIKKDPMFGHAVNNENIEVIASKASVAVSAAGAAAAGKGK